MRVLFLNLPYRTKIMRRYGCSYNAQGHLFPPLELCSAATAIREWNGAEVNVIDAAAEGLSLAGTAKRAKAFAPDIIVSLAGFESLEDDLASMDHVKGATGAKTVLCGYLPTLFPNEVMRKSDVDFLVLGELEKTISELIACLQNGGSLAGVKGLAWRGAKITVNEKRPRIVNIDCLPVPDRRLLDNGLYSMPFFGRPFTSIQTSRGCQFSCTYCTHFEGHGAARRSVSKVIDELRQIRALGIRHVRFMDNNFTSPPEHAKELCKAIYEARLGLTWACLTRADMIDYGLARLMRKAGCTTVFIGIESGSQETLKRYKKGYTISGIERCVKAIKDSGMETVGWFIFGAPWESEKDFIEGVDLAKRLRLDYAIASSLSYFPGTELFDNERRRLDFSLIPFEVAPKDKALRERGVIWEKRFYRKFYISPSACMRMAFRAASHPRDAWISAKNLVRYVYSSRNADFF